MNMNNSTQTENISFYKVEDTVKVVEFIKASGATGGETVTEADILRFFESASQQETERIAARDLLIEESKRQNALAQTTPCAYENCDGTGHDRLGTPKDWWHRVVSETFDEAMVKWDVSRNPDGEYIGNISMESEGDVTSAELRATADTYEAFPAFLRAQADRLDALNGVNN